LRSTYANTHLRWLADNAQENDRFCYKWPRRSSTSHCEAYHQKSGPENPKLSNTAEPSAGLALDSNCFRQADQFGSSIRLTSSAQKELSKALEQSTKTPNK